MYLPVPESVMIHDIIRIYCCCSLVNIYHVNEYSLLARGA